MQRYLKYTTLLVVAVLVAVMQCGACRVGPDEDPGDCPPYEVVTDGVWEVRYIIEECWDEDGMICCRVDDECDC